MEKAQGIARFALTCGSQDEIAIAANGWCSCVTIRAIPDQGSPQGIRIHGRALVGHWLGTCREPRTIGGHKMLVIVMENQLLPPQNVCQGCLMADQGGRPRWQAGELRCGRSLTRSSDNLPEQYECQMGFRIANIE